MNSNLEHPQPGAEVEPYECDACGADVAFEDQICPSCGADISEVDDSDEDETTTSENPVVHRYLDLYRAARLLIAIGSTVKVVGIVLATGIFLLWFVGGMVASMQPQTSPFGSTQRSQSGPEAFLIFGGFVVGAVFGALVGGVVFLLGILISAQGQILLAQADAAIHTSPFLTEKEKARAMSLHYPRAAERVAPERVP